MNAMKKYFKTMLLIVIPVFVIFLLILFGMPFLAELTVTTGDYSLIFLLPVGVIVAVLIVVVAMFKLGFYKKMQLAAMDVGAEQVKEMQKDESFKKMQEEQMKQFMETDQMKEFREKMKEDLKSEIKTENKVQESD